MTKVRSEQTLAPPGPQPPVEPSLDLVPICHGNSFCQQDLLTHNLWQSWTRWSHHETLFTKNGNMFAKTGKFINIQHYSQQAILSITENILHFHLIQIFSTRNSQFNKNNERYNIFSTFSRHQTTWFPCGSVFVSGSFTNRGPPHPHPPL